MELNKTVMNIVSVCIAITFIMGLAALLISNILFYQLYTIWIVLGLLSLLLKTYWDLYDK